MIKVFEKTTRRLLSIFPDRSEEVEAKGEELKDAGIWIEYERSRDGHFCSLVCKRQAPYNLDSHEELAFKYTLPTKDLREEIDHMVLEVWAKLHPDQPAGNPTNLERLPTL